MNGNRIALSSMAMDLKRVALGYHRGSNIMAERFLEEALKRKNDLDISKLKPYLKKIIQNLERIQSQKDKHEVAEYALLCSTLIQNAALTFN